MTWNLNLSEAPRDRRILAADGKSDLIIVTKWKETKAGGYWPGFREDGKCPPMAWAELPLHPHHMPPAELSPVSADSIPFIDDVGGAEHE
jgi:hypothetical protein